MRMNLLTIIMFFMTFSVLAQVDTYRTTGSGDWTDPIWICDDGSCSSIYPESDDIVYVRNGHSVDVTTPQGAVSLTITGVTRGNTSYVNVYSTLSISGDITLNTNSDIGLLGGTLQIGGSFVKNAGTGTFTPYVQGNGPTTTVYNGNNSQTIYPATLTFGSGSPYYNLTINKSGTATLSGNTELLNNLLISSGTMDKSTYNLTLEGDFENNAVFTSSGGSTIFSGTGGDISGSGTTNFINVIFNGNTNLSHSGDVIVSSNGLVTLGNSVTVSSSGTVGSGLGYFILRSTSNTQTARIASVPSTSSITANNITVERFLNDITTGTGLTEDYRYIASPIPVTIAQWQDNLSITGFTGGNPCSGCLNNDNMFLYDESVTGNLSNGYVGYPDAASDPIPVGRGYAFYQRDEDSPVTIDMTGTPTVGDFSGFPLEYSPSTQGEVDAYNTANGTSLSLADYRLANDGWNLIGNPYPSPIAWSTVTSGQFSNLSGSIYIRSNGQTAGIISNNYATYIHTADGTGIGTNNYTGEIAVGQAFWVKATGSNPTLTLTENNKASSATFFRKAEPENVLRVWMENSEGNADESVVYFRESASGIYEPDQDAIKLAGAIVNFSTLSDDGVKLVINGLSVQNCISIPLAVDATNKTGEYKFYVSNLESFGYDVEVTLYDSYIDSTTVLGNSNEYKFNITNDLASKGSERFVLNINKAPTTNLDVQSIESICFGENGSVSINNPEAGVTYEAVIGDEVVAIATSTENSPISLDIPSEFLNVGQVDIKLMANTECLSGKREISQIPITIEELPTPEILRVNEYTLRSNYNEGNQWYFNGEPIDGATQNELHISETGLYELEVTNSKGCSAKVEDSLIVTSIDEELENFGVQVYPNPVEDILKVDIKEYKNAHIFISTINGKLKHTKQLKKGINEINISNLDPGLYFLKIRNKNKDVVVRIIKK